MKTAYQPLIDKELLKEEKISFADVRKVLSKAQSNLKSAEILLANKQYENSFELSYEAMLSAGRALSFSFGLRPRTQGSHKIVADFVELVLGKDHLATTLKFNKMRKKRHYLIYGAGLEISKTEAQNAMENAGGFFAEIKKIIQAKDPQKELF
jgi:uncharacterized protein (UPF0332 family)